MSRLGLFAAAVMRSRCVDGALGSSAAPEVCREARRPKRWFSQYYGCCDGVKSPASASMRSLRRVAANFGSEDPCRRVFLAVCMHGYSGRVSCPESCYIATITHSPTTMATAAFRGRRARLARLADPPPSPRGADVRRRARAARYDPCPRASSRPRGDRRAWRRGQRSAHSSTASATASWHF